MDQTFRILVSNDDGIGSAGIGALTAAMRTLGHVDVVAPMTQQSAVGHALTVATPLRVVPHERDGQPFGRGVSGTPADCIKLAVHHLLPERPHLVVSGINHGRNTAVSLIYSGTVSAATEGTMLGIPSIAFSLDDFAEDADFTVAARVARWVVSNVRLRGLPRGVLLNVNIPRLADTEIRGIRIAPQGESYWNDIYDVRRDPMNRLYYWLTGNHVILGPDNSDDELLTAGYVTITPVHHRLTDDPMIAELQTWEIERDGGIESL